MGREMTKEAEKNIKAQKAQAIASAKAAMKKAEEQLKAAQKGLAMAEKENK